MEINFMYTGRTAGLENMRTLGVDVSRETAIVTDPVKFPSRTIQSAKDDADINVIVKRFGLTGAMPAAPRMPSYGDYSGVGDFQSAMNAVRQAEESFMELPANVRSRFGNDPQAFLEFSTNPDNLGDLVKMGLAKAVPSAIITSPDVPVKEKVNASGPSKRAGKVAEASRKSDSDGDGE